MKTNILSSSKSYSLSDEDNNCIIQLQLKNPTFLKTDLWEGSEGTVTVGIPIEVWRDITEGWAETEWAKDPEKDNTGYDE